MWKERLGKRARQASVLLFWPGVALVVWGALTPTPPQLTGPWAWDKLDHFSGYFGLAIMATLAIGAQRRLAPAIVGLVALGGALEILQGYVGRDPEWGDFIANSIGVAAGTIAGLIFLRVMQSPLVAERAGD